jgi:hypothetical protein
MVTAYELFRAGRRSVAGTRRASHQEKARMLELLREGLLHLEALPAVNTDGYFQGWRALFERADLTKQVRLDMAQDGARLTRSRRSPTCACSGGALIPELKWRELVFVGALRPDASDFVRDPPPLPPFRLPDLFPGRPLRGHLPGGAFPSARRTGRASG